MRDVVVIGGGLTGLSACYQLQQLGVDYTVIELKRRFGGRIETAREKSFVMDASVFAFGSLADEPWLPELGLDAEIRALDARGFHFRAGTDRLVAAMAARLQGGHLMRMAVSSLGRLGGRFAICLENGLMLDAGALIAAVPARYAARMLYNLAPEAAQRLANTRYESVWQVALGYRKVDLPRVLPDTEFLYLWTSDVCGRVPDRQHRLVQLAMSAPAECPSSDVIDAASRRLGGMAQPVVARAWQFDVARSIFGDEHAGAIRAIRARLPQGISLVGSEYLLSPRARPGLAQLAERIGAGRQAACDAVAFRRGSRRL